MGRSRRVTIDDIAAEAGVSAASVSYALNGKPGVSRQTRERVLAIARSHNWEPSHVARALQDARVQVVGLVVPMSDQALHDEAFWMMFIGGIESELRQHGYSLLLHLEPDLPTELEIYRSWSRRGLVDSVILADLYPDDPRIPVLAQLGLPAVLAGRPDPDPGWPYCFSSDADDMELVLRWLRGRGVTRFARLAGNEDYVFVAERTHVWRRELGAPGLVDCATAHADFHPGRGDVAEAVTTLLAAEPEVIVADSDLLAVGALRALLDRGLRVPDDVELVSFDESVLCQVVTPSVTALDRDPRELGQVAARVALGQEVGRVHRTRPGVIHERESTRSGSKSQPSSVNGATLSP